jgi:diguanylate cyclase (GGDEF)-like protein
MYSAYYLRGAFRTMELGNDQDFITAVQRTVQAERPAMALMLGIKKFKIINRIYGYHFGSKILAAFGDLLGEELQGKGTVCRMDGTKFVLCVPGMSVVEAQLFFSRVRTRAVDSIRVDDKPVSLFLSGGAIPLDD